MENTPLVYYQACAKVQYYLLVLKFLKPFLSEKAIYDYVSLPAQIYDFISETVTSANLTKKRNR